MARKDPEIKEVEVSTSEARLGGELNVPQDASGIVVFVHGSGSSRHSPRNKFVARTLQAFGLGTFLFDLLTPAEERQEAYTRHLRFDIQMLSGRLMEATEWLRTQAEAQERRIGYFGSSTGAAAALIAGAEFGREIGAIVSRG